MFISNKANTVIRVGSVGKELCILTGCHSDVQL